MFLLIFLLAVKYVVSFISLSLSFYPSYTLFSVAIQIIVIIVNYFVRIIRSSRNQVTNYRYGDIFMFITFAVWMFIYTKTIVEPITLLPLYHYYKIYHYYKTSYEIVLDSLALSVFMISIATYIKHEYEDKGIIITDDLSEVSPRNDKNGSELQSILVMHIILFLIAIIPLRYFVHIFVELSIFFIFFLDLLFVLYLLYIYTFVRFLNSKYLGGYEG